MGGNAAAAKTATAPHHRVKLRRWEDMRQIVIGSERRRVPKGRTRKTPGPESRTRPTCAAQGASCCVDPPLGCDGRRNYAVAGAGLAAARIADLLLLTN